VFLCCFVTFNFLFVQEVTLLFAFNRSEPVQTASLPKKDANDEKQERDRDLRFDVERSALVARMRHWPDRSYKHEIRIKRGVDAKTAESLQVDLRALPKHWN